MPVRSVGIFFQRIDTEDKPILILGQRGDRFTHWLSAHEPAGNTGLTPDSAISAAFI